MKNQYVGDICDYGKYGLLRYLAKQYRVGINWYLTENDQSNDGKFTKYLEKPKNRKYDPELFDALTEIAFRNDKGVDMVESAKLIPNAAYFSAILKSEKLPVVERYIFRQEWHHQTMQVLAEADLVFCDPDNGPIGSKSIGTKQSEKYDSPSELADYYNRGQNVVYFCQKARRTDEAWEFTKREMLSKVAGASVIVLTFHGGQQRSYIFVVHAEDYNGYRKALNGFLQIEWKDYFDEEKI